MHSSSGFGAASTGSSSPKWLNSWPGRLRTALAATFGDAGTGYVPCSATVHTTPAYDPRWGFGGTVSDVSAGWHKAAAYRVAGGVSNYVEFTPTAPVAEFWVHTLLGSSGYGWVSVDGVTVGSLRNQTGGTAPTLEREAGYHAGQCMTRVPAGALGTHTLRVWGDSTLTLLGVEGRNPGGGWIVDNPSMNGKSLSSLGVNGDGNDDEAGGTYGLPMLDSLCAMGPGPVLIGLSTNEWQGTDTAATLQTRIGTAVARIAAAGREPVVYVQPQPSVSLQGGTMTYTDLVTAAHAAADAARVRCLDQWRLWAPTLTDEAAIYSAGQGAGMYADTIHPSDTGAASIAAAVRTWLAR